MARRQRKGIDDYLEKVKDTLEDVASIGNPPPNQPLTPQGDPYVRPIRPAHPRQKPILSGQTSIDSSAARKRANQRKQAAAVARRNRANRNRRIS